MELRLCSCFHSFSINGQSILSIIVFLTGMSMKGCLFSLTVEEWFPKHQEIQDIVDAYFLENSQHLGETRDWLLHYR